MRLDVGCGIRGTGDVNCDLNPTVDKGHRSGVIGNPHKYENFVQCDAQHLPFQANTFSMVYSEHLIEHVPNPTLLLSELVRVSKDKIEVRCPHRYGDKMVHGPFGKPHPEHVNSLSLKWFYTTLKRMGYPVFGYVSRWLHLPTEYISIFRVPLEITIYITKVKQNAP